MKLTVGGLARKSGFALPTILLVSTVMLMILAASIAATAASRVSLDSQYYNKLAQQAAQSGVARATECLKSNAYIPQWSVLANNRNLRPNSDCTGATMTGGYVRDYVVGQAGGSPTAIRTEYSVEAPGGTGIGSTLRIVGTTELVRTSSPYNVWRSYEQSLYLRIEPPKKIVCPVGFISVPGDSRFNTNDFCVGKYEAKNVGGKAVSQADGIPQNNISRDDAIAAASRACSGCQLISENQWLTIAHNVLNVSSNWTSGTVGNGEMYRGHSDNSPASPLAASSNDDDGYFGTGNTSGNQRRTLKLNNGETIWDFSGDLEEVTTGVYTGTQPGNSASNAFTDWNALGGIGALNPNVVPSYGTSAASAWTRTQGIGALYSNNTASYTAKMMRGGHYNTSTSTGIFTLSLTNTTASAGSVLQGFRVAFVPLSEITCSSGFVPVPGNSLFGTSDFCVGKYEAKNVSGVAVSQAAGTPWASISQTSAVTAANNACAKCRLINEAEWLTIAHNIVNVPSNWSSGTVGSGTLYRGHTDNSPANSIVASSDDNSPYTNTGNASGDQRRTHMLSNGSVIWDFTGNVQEWTSGQITGGQPAGSGSGYVTSEWNAVSGGEMVPSPYPAYATSAAAAWSATQNLGRVVSNSADATLRGFVRGGSYNLTTSAGPFYLSFASAPTATSTQIGFRIVEVIN